MFHERRKLDNYKIKMFVFILFLLMNFQYFSFSQEIGRMETDRPDQTECPFIVKKGYFQLESGFNKNYISYNSEFYLPTSLLKYGISKKIEFRHLSVVNISDQNFRFRNEAVGLKILLFEKTGILPKTSLIAHYHLGDLKRDLADLNRMPHSLGDIVFTSQHELNDKLSVGYNYGIEFHNDGKHEGIFRIAPGLNIGDKMYAYLETFGRFPFKIYDDIWVDGGIAYYLNNDVKFDLSFGHSVKIKRDYYFALGFSYRFKLM